MRAIDLILKKLLVLAVVLAILSGAVEAKKSAWQPEIRIGLMSGVTSVTLQMSAPSVIVDADTNKTLRKVAAGENFSIDFAQLDTTAIEIRGENVPLQDLRATINGKKYFGGVRVNKAGGGLTVINLAPVEEYLRGVVPEEMVISFHAEALKAQAVAARSFTLKNRNRHKAEGYDLCATTHCQTYNGVEEVAATDKAIRDTRGVIVTYNGTVADTNFHTDSGGFTENVLDVWGGGGPYLQAVKELEIQTQPWKLEFSARDFVERLDASLGNLKAVRLSKLVVGKSDTDRTASGRVKFVTVAGAKKTINVTGGDLRAKFSLPSTLFDVSFRNGTVTFAGYGRGHGVGMSQYGAQAYAKSGWSYEKILAHYYRGTALKKLY